MNDHQVVVVGAGPAGMMLAAELTLADVDVVVIERRPTTALESPRSRGLHSRTLEVLDQRGIADRFVAAGTPAQVQAFAGTPLDIGDFPTRYPHGLALTQSDFEQIMAGWIDELGVRVLRDRTVTGYVDHSDHVEITCADGAVLRAEYLVGCDGGRSVIRRSAGIEFAGWDPTVCWIHTEVEVDERPPYGLRGGGGVGPADGGRVGVTLAEPDHSDQKPGKYREKLTNLGDGTHQVERAVDNVWDDIPGLGTTPGEDVGYPTQKTEALLRRIIAASTAPGDLVLDCFMGSGTTVAVAQQMGRRWIGGDANWGSLQATRRRLHRLAAGETPPAFTVATFAADGSPVESGPAG